MQYKTTHEAIEKIKSDCIIVAAFDEKNFHEALKKIDVMTKGHIKKLLVAGDISTQCGDITLLPQIDGAPAPKLMIVGAGLEAELSDKRFRKLHAAAARALRCLKIKKIDNLLTQLNVKNRDTAWKVSQAVLTFENNFYEYDETKSEKKKKNFEHFSVTHHIAHSKDVKAAHSAVDSAHAIAEGVRLTKNLANLPANVCTPTYLAGCAKHLEKQFKKISTTVLEEAQLKKLGMHSLLSVANGSEQPAKLITMEYSGGKKSEKPVVIIGKGITFDSGGISLKPGPRMDEMKFDMCGAASVFGVMHAVATLGLPINLVGVVPTTENLPSGCATKPGDIVTSMAGLTIEILNTDAEGRLILCDALTYSKKFKPELVIDVATLTGAMVVSLGEHATGIMGNHQPLADAVLRAGEKIGDRAWQLPLWEEYAESLESNFADMANVGNPGGGSLIAASFLEKFARDFRWLHMDIAGTAYLTGKCKGATGRPVPALMQFLLDRLT